MTNRIEQRGRRAIVIGGSIAGLFASRILSEFYDSVILVERDELPADSVKPRRGVIQGQHAHGLLASGTQVLEELFPGIGEELIGNNGLSADMLEGIRWCVEGGCLKQVASGSHGLLATRPLLESVIRKRVRATERIQVLDNCGVHGLFSYNRRVKGIRIDGGILEADLVVDATGRGSRAPQWIGSLGYPKPRDERIEVRIAYTTRLFRLRPGMTEDCPVTVIPAQGVGKNSGVLAAQEDGLWIATLIGYFGEQAPPELSGFVEYARNLPAPYIHDFLRKSEPVGEAVTTRFPASVRRRYDRLNRFPDGFLVFGDAVCSFNPVYGQGMSVAALQALALRESLSKGTNGLSRRFFKKAARIIDIPWNIAAGGDLKKPETVGKRTFSMRMINWYIGQLHRAAHHDAFLSLAFLRVAQLLASPASLMRPAIIWRVLSARLRNRRTEAAPATGHEITAS